MFRNIKPFFFVSIDHVVSSTIKQAMLISILMFSGIKELFVNCLFLATIYPHSQGYETYIKQPF